MPPNSAAALKEVKLRVSPNFAGPEPGSDLVRNLWTALQPALEEKALKWSNIDDDSLGGFWPPKSMNADWPWAFYDCDFPYAPHRALIAASEEGVTGAVEAELLGQHANTTTTTSSSSSSSSNPPWGPSHKPASGGLPTTTKFPVNINNPPPSGGLCTTTKFPVVLIVTTTVVDASLVDRVAAFVSWLQTAPRPFNRQTRTLLLSLAPAASVAQRPQTSAALGTCLVRHGIGVVEARSVDDAACYIVQCGLSLGESKKRRLPSRFKVQGSRCQTLPRNPHDQLRLTWVSQLMQLAGVSEEIAKAVAERHATPAALMQAIEAVEAENVGPAAKVRAKVAEGFLADLEYPIRGKKGTKRLGPVVSRRIFSLFHPETTPEHVLV